MASKFIELRTVTGALVILNTTYISQISPTHGSDFSNGVDVAFLTLGQEGLLQVSLPASQVDALLTAVNASDSHFINLALGAGIKLILNQEYITHIQPTHGDNLADGADISLWGSTIQVPASSVGPIAALIKKSA